MGNLVVGLGFLIIIFFAARSAISDMKKGKCSGCSSSSSCKKTAPVEIKF